MIDLDSGVRVRAKRTWLASGCSAVALLAFTAPALAQEIETESEEIAEQASEDTIVVTGSRLIIPSGMDSATPVTSVTEEEIDTLDPGTLIQAMNVLPIFVNNNTPNSNAGFFARSGTGNLNLRGLGTNRTLTLLNGRRIAPSTAFGGADINLIPAAMLKGVENVTGGASAAYGTDAVAGVTNFLLDTRFTGIEANIQGGITQRGDGENVEASLSFGTPIGDRAHLLLSGEYNKFWGIFGLQDRNWYKAYGLLDSNGDGIDEVWPDVHSARASYDGIISSPGFAFNGFQFDANGGLAPYQLGVATDGGVLVGIDPRTSGGSGDDLGCGEQCNVYPDTDRYSLFAYGDYEVTSNITLFAQYMRGYSHLYELGGGGSFGFTNNLTIYQDNFYLNRDYPDVAAALQNDPNRNSFILRRMCSIEDCGNLYYEEWSTQNIGTTGFEANVDNDGGWFDDWRIAGYVQYAHSKKVWDQFGMRMDRIYAAIDAVDNGSGSPVCRVTLFNSPDFPGCQPIDLFGRGNASPEAVDYVTGMDPGEQITTPLFFADTGFDLGITDSYTSTNAKRAITTFKQKFAELSFAGNLIDNWVGPISVAFGASYRSDSIYQINRDPAHPTSNHETGHPVLCSGESPGLRGVNGGDCANTVATQYSKTSNIQGSADVKEIFGELLFPLFDFETGQRAGLNVAARWADYEGSGQIWSYKGSLDFAVTDDVRLRGTYSRDVRAANLNERFNKTGGVGNLTDPRISTADQQACQALNNPGLNCSAAYQITTFSGGNPNVKPEKADTFTAGIVARPQRFPGLSMSVDWFKADIKGAIGQVGVNEVARRCYEDEDPQFCDLITESVSDTTDAGGYPLVILAGDQYVNVEKASVEGLDVEIGYNSSVNFTGGENERLGLRLFGTWLFDRSNTGAATPANNFDPQPIQLAGYTSFPTFRTTGLITYTTGPINASLTVRGIGKSKRQNIATQGAAGITVTDNTIPSVVYFDTRINYEFDLAGTEAQAFFAINNLLDKDPPVYATYSAFTQAATQTFPALHDVLGRRFTVGLKLRMR